MRHSSSSSFPIAALAAAAVLLLIGQVATATDLCAEANYNPLCQSLLFYGTDAQLATDAQSATVSVLDNLIRQTNHGRSYAAGLGIGGDKIAQGCKENYVDALGKLQESLKYLKVRDKGGFGTAISGAIAAYSICEDTYAEFGLISPLAKINMLMSHTADVCLTLYNQIN